MKQPPRRGSAVGFMVEYDWQAVKNLFTPTNDSQGNLISTVVRLFDQPVVNSGSGSSLTVGNIVATVVEGDAITIEGDPTSYTVAAVTGFDTAAETVTVTLNTSLAAPPPAENAVSIIRANGSVVGWKGITVNAHLEQGNDQADLSGDQVSAADYPYEVWTIMLENFAEMKGGYNNIVGGTSGDVWTALRGPGYATYHPAGDYSSGAAMMVAIKAILDNGGQVGVSIKEHPNPADLSAESIVIPDRPNFVPDVSLTGGMVYGNHVYIVKIHGFRTNPTPGLQGVLAMQLYNPWGAESGHPWVIGSDLEKFVEGIYELR